MNRGAPPKPAPRVNANPGASSGYKSTKGQTATPSGKYTPSPVSSLGPLAVQTVPGSSQPTPGETNYQPDDPSQLLQALAEHLGIDPTQGGPNLLDAVAAKLGHQYGVVTGTPPVNGPKGQPQQGKPGKPGTPGQKGGGPGVLGQIESGVDRADKDVAAPLAGILAPGASMISAAASGRNPETVEGPGKGTKGKPGKPGTKGSAKDEPTAPPPPEATGQYNPAEASQFVLHSVAAKLGADASKDPISAIAERLGVKPGTTTNTPPGQTGNQSVAEIYADFTKSLGAPDKNSQAYIQGRVKALESAGFLDTNQANDKSAIEEAYKKLLTESVTTKTPMHQVLADHAVQNQNIVKGGGTSEAVAYVQQEADSLGVALTPDEVTGIANAYTGTSSADQIRAAIIKQYDPTNPNNPPGLATAIASGIQGEANNYQVPLSQAAVGNYVKNALNQGVTDSGAAVDAAKQTLQQQAAGLYPTLAPQILAGNDVKTLVDPYFQVAQTYTGIPASTMQADDPSGKWSKFLQGGRDANGAPTMMTLDQWKKTIMQDPNDSYGFQKTQGAHNMVADFATSLLNAFGKVNTGAGTDFSQYSGTPGTANNP